MPDTNEVVFYHFDGTRYKTNVEAGTKLAEYTSGGLKFSKVGFYDKNPISQPASANQAAVSGTAGSTYTATEQQLLNNVVTLANALREALVNLGLIKGSA